MEKVEKEVKIGTEGAMIRIWTSGEKQLVTKEGVTFTKNDIDEKISRLYSEINFLSECRERIKDETIGSLSVKLLEKMLLK